MGCRWCIRMERVPEVSLPLRNEPMGEAKIHRNTSFAKLFYIYQPPGPTNLEPSAFFSQLWPYCWQHLAEKWIHPYFILEWQDWLIENENLRQIFLNLDVFSCRKQIFCISALPTWSVLLLLYSYYFDRGSDLSLDMNPLYLDISFTHVLVFLGLWSRERNRNFSLL